MGPLATNAQPPAATRAPSDPPQEAAAGAATPQLPPADRAPSPKEAQAAAAEGYAETPEDDTGPRAANAAAAQPSTAGGPERAGTEQPAIVASMWSKRLLVSTSGKPKGYSCSMES